MRKAKMRYIAPIVLVILGVSWLLDTLDVVPGVRWVQTVGLATTGILTFIIGGVDRFTVVMGPFLMTTSLCTLLKQLGKLPPDREMPILVIVFGCLLILVQVLKIRTPSILTSDFGDAQKEQGRE